MIDKILFPDPILVPTPREGVKPGKAGVDNRNSAFAKVLDGKLPTPGLKFSQHARERLDARGIKLSGTDMERLEKAVETVEKKGGRESLVMMGDSAFVVSVKNRTVITALDRDVMKGNVFTNIDSAVVL